MVTYIHLSKMHAEDAWPLGVVYLSTYHDLLSSNYQRPRNDEFRGMYCYYAVSFAYHLCELTVTEV